MNFYQNCATILRDIETKSQNFKSVIFRYKDEPRFQAKYSILLNIIQKKVVVNKILYFLKGKEKVSNNFFMKILIYEKFLSGKKLKMGGKLMKIIKKYKTEIEEKFGSEINKNKIFIKKRVFLRINSEVKEKEQIEQLKEAGKKDDVIDNLYSMHYQDYSTFNKEKFPLYFSKDVVIQSKASCLPVFVLK